MIKKITSFLMGKISLVFIMLLLILSGSFFITNSQAAGIEFKAEMLEILVKSKDQTFKKVPISKDQNLWEEIYRLREDKRVEWAEPNYKYQVAIIPSDPYFNSQWYLNRIKAPEAWDITRESPEIVIAIIDSGIQVKHQDLKDNIWRNENELINNGIDDDGNGFIDDINGWDFVENRADPGPKFNENFTNDGIIHGTVIAGIIAGYGNNGVGISGITWQAKLMSLRVLNSSGEGGTLNVIKAIDYAIKKEADIINLSFVGYGYSRSLEEKIKEAYDAGIIIVAAAGNDQNGGAGGDLDEEPIYPACHDGPAGENWVIGVAATDALDQKAEFSSYGFKCVDISAPGVSIFSTTVYNSEIQDFSVNYDGYWAGTSMASPMVSATVALIEATNPQLLPNEIIDLILNNTDNINRLNPDYLGRLGAGRLNIYESVKNAKELLDNSRVSLILAPQINKESQIKISEKNGQILNDFFAYHPDFRGGVNVASGDIDGDGIDEIITGAGNGGGPQIRIFNSKGDVQGQFFAYDKNFRGGVNVAIGRVNSGAKNKKAKIIAAPGPGGGPHIRIFDNHAKVLYQFFAFDEKFKGGVNIAAADLNYDGFDEIVAGAGPGGSPHVRIFNRDGILLNSFFAYEAEFNGGVSIATLNY